MSTESACRDFAPSRPRPSARARTAAPRGSPRPLREACMVLDVCKLAASGLLEMPKDGSVLLELLGPRSRGIRSFGSPKDEIVVRNVRTDRPVDGGMASVTLKIGDPYPGHAWAVQVPVKINPGRRWRLRCQGCGGRCRKLFWPPGGSEWRCGPCHRVKYPDPGRLATLPHRPDGEDLDALIRECQRLKLVRRDVRRATMGRPRTPSAYGSPPK